MTVRQSIGMLCAILLGSMLAGCEPQSTSVNPRTPVLAAPAQALLTANAVDQPQMWLSTADGTRALDLATVSVWHPYTSGPGPVVNVDPDERFQTMAGFGAAITDSSAWLIQNRMNASQRDALMRELFGRDRGLGLSITRLTIGASDFSRSHYSYLSSSGAFDVSPVEVDVLPTVRNARALNPQLTIAASPWSAPAAFKTSGSLIRGELRDENYDAYARYLRDYLVEMGTRGVPIDALTIQNEPSFEPTDYPGMRMSAAQRARFIGQHLGPLLARDGLRTQIWEWDHNWDHPEEPLAVLADARAAQYISGVAWHCYAGDVGAQGTVRAAFPDKDVWFTECSGGAWAPDYGDSLSWMTRTLIIGATRNWARGVVLWNLALDGEHGPHNGGCSNCRGVVTIDQATGAVTRNVEYFVLAHASRFVRPGAQRIASDTGTDGIDTVAFRNADDGSLSLIAVNAATSSRAVRIRQASREFSADLPAGAVATFTWQ